MSGRAQPVVRRVASSTSRISAPPSQTSMASGAVARVLVASRWVAEIIDRGDSERDQQPVDDPHVAWPSPLRQQRKEEEGRGQDEPEKGGAVDRGVDRELRPVERIERKRRRRSPRRARPASRRAGASRPDSLSTASASSSSWRERLAAPADEATGASAHRDAAALVEFDRRRMKWHRRLARGASRASVAWRPDGWRATSARLSKMAARISLTSAAIERFRHQQHIVDAEHRQIVARARHRRPP